MMQFELYPRLETPFEYESRLWKNDGQFIIDLDDVERRFPKVTSKVVEMLYKINKTKTKKALEKIEIDVHKKWVTDKLTIREYGMLLVTINYRKTSENLVPLK